MNYEYMEEYAGFGRRLVAFFIDLFFFSFATAIIHALIFGDAGLRIVASESGVQVFSSSTGWFEQLIIMSVTVFMWVRFLGTPGKLLLGCHIVDANTKQPLKIPQALVRYVAYIVSAIPLGLGFLWIIWDKRKQAFHDKIAKSVVIVESHQWGDDESQKTLEQLMKEVR